MNRLKKFFAEYNVPLGIFLFSRILVVLTIVLINMFHVWPGVRLEEWDARNYITVAQNGYQYDGDYIGRSGFIAYFPFLPTVLQIGNQLTGLSFITVGLTLSFFFGLASAVLLYILVKEWADKKAATTAVLLYSFFPMSFFFSAIYTESFFFFFTLSAFYFMNKNEHLKALIFVALSLITRITGGLLGLIFAWNVWRKTKSVVKTVGYGVLALIPFFAFMYFQYTVYGTPFAFMDALSGNWSNDSVWPWQGFYIYVSNMFVEHLAPEVWRSGVGILFLSLVTLVASYKRVPNNIWYFGLGVLILTLSSDRILSMGRYLMLVLPMYYFWGKVLSKRELVLNLVLVFSAGWLVLNTALHVLGKGIF